MKSNLSILFYPKSRSSSNNILVPIYLRITINGERAEISIKRKIQLIKWNGDGGRARGTTLESREMNSYLDSIRYRIYEIQKRLFDQNKIISAQLVKNIFIGKEDNEKMLLKIFQDHNDQVDSLIGKEFAEGTAERYRTARAHLERFIKKEYKGNDIPVQNVDHKFISGFEYYLKKERKCSHNTAIKYITNCKKIIRIAFANGWIKSDPFFNWKARLKIVDREFLTEIELQNMMDLQLCIPRINQVKDIFTFCCFTGLAYADVKKLSKNDIVMGIDGGRWIKTKRTKTDTKTNVPLLPSAEEILERYENHPSTYDSDLLLPVLSNQKMNAYLKEVADLCGINKNLTFHLARHTFATTVTLSNGVPIESVSKMLGHTNLKTTQHYAKILDMKVSKDMEILRNKFK
jgi:integrase